ncbi:hypothetical protein Tco_1428669 [Tanacetum coccineum]
MASTRASISKVSKRPKINIIPPKQLFVDLTQDDTKTPSPKLPNSSPSAPNAPSKTPSTKDTSSSSIDYIPKSPTSSTSPSPNGYLNPSTSPPPRVSPPPPTQDNASMDITLTLSPNTPLDVQFDTPSPSPPIIAHPIPWNFLEAHGLVRACMSILSLQAMYDVLSSSWFTTFSESNRKVPTLNSFLIQTVMLNLNEDELSKPQQCLFFPLRPKYVCIQAALLELVLLVKDCRMDQPKAFP